MAVTVTNQGLLSPGFGSGVGFVTIQGEYHQNAGGSFNVDLTGAGLGQYDQLWVEGTATLGGVLDVDYIGGFEPSPGTALRILTCDVRNAMFANVTDSVFGAGAGQFLQPLYFTDRVMLYCPLAGDANFDGFVSGADYTIWADHFGAGATWGEGDFNGDGHVSGADYTIWADNFGQSVSLNAVAVPEPSGWPLVVAGLSIWVMRRKRSDGSSCL